MNHFRGQRLKNHIREVFTQVVLLLMEAGHVDLKAVYTDGTKLEANANKYTFVWAKSIATNKKKMKAQLEELWNYTQGVATGMNSRAKTPEMQKLNSKKVEQTIDAINAALKDKSVDSEGETEVELRQEELAGQPAQIQDAGVHPGRSRQLLQDRHGGHLHAHEGRPYGQRAIEGGLQRAMEHPRPVRCPLYPAPGHHRYQDPDPTLQAASRPVGQTTPSSSGGCGLRL